MSEENVTSNEVAPEIIREAESQGWVPKERFRGNESDWVDAEIFVKRGREILPILRKNNENLMKDLTATKEQLKEFREAAEEFKKFQQETYKRKAQEYEQRIQEIKESRAQAISDGDGQKVNALDDALDQAKDELKEAKQAVRDADKPSAEPESNTPNTVEPGLQVWLDRNTWFGQDRRMTALANGIGESLRAEFPSLKGEEFLEKLDEVLAEEFPNKFGKKQSPASRVESGSGRTGRSSGNAQTYDNLPADAKAACDRFVKQKLMTREQYVADFDWN
ncbi:hypothetical protein UFOVP135_38 [uncultured Caudovirales phage]|uniref:Uncharacterized protein n=1 Tax=uncultured Caudovirales phage TaxID=2100421 RepID=A0A6J5LBK2_9CAUD|nr:hypothetical protein UFOVP135_38 [uncultured Caudovirales phage]